MSRPIDPEQLFRDVTGILKDMTSDWEGAFDEEIRPETRLIADLGFESIDVVEFVVAIEERFGRRDLPVGQLLMVDGRYVEDLRVADIVRFLGQHLRHG
jgi:acyl carrier protein